VREIGILHLGGRVERAHRTADEAQIHPDARVVISGEREPAAVRDILHARGVGLERVQWEFEAWDTVSNFTETIGLFLGIRELRVVTDPFHRRRAWLVGRIVYAFTGVRIVMAVSDGPGRDPWLRLVRDIVRAIRFRLSGNLPHDPFIRFERLARQRQDELTAIELGLPVAWRSDV
jgi:hypothetical protein